MQTKDDLSAIAAEVYDYVFTRSGGGDDTVGDTFGNAPDRNLVLSYRDWYRAQVGNAPPWQLDYTKPVTNQTLQSYARYLAQPAHSDKTAIVIHGIMSNSMNTGPWARAFYDLGYNVLTPDLRGHGLSKDPDRNIGVYDSDDILRWAAELVKKNSNAEIVLFGYSMGAATALESAYKNSLKNIVAIVEDCGFAEFPILIRAAIKEHFDFLSDDQTETVTQHLNELLKEYQGFQIIDGLTLAGLMSAKPPLLVIHGEADPVIPVFSAKMIFGVYGGSPKNSYLVPNAQHTQSIAYGYPQYRQTIDSFMKSVLSEPPRFVWDSSTDQTYTAECGSQTIYASDTAEGQFVKQPGMSFTMDAADQLLTLAIDGGDYPGVAWPLRADHAPPPLPGAPRTHINIKSGKLTVLSADRPTSTAMLNPPSDLTLQGSGALSLFMDDAVIFADSDQVRTNINLSGNSKLALRAAGKNHPGSIWVSGQLTAAETSQFEANSGSFATPITNEYSTQPFTALVRDSATMTLRADVFRFPRKATFSIGNSTATAAIAFFPYTAGGKPPFDFLAPDMNFQEGLFNFITKNGTNLGRFVFYGIGSGFQFNAMLNNRLVFVDGVFSEKARFGTDYTAGNLTFWLEGRIA